MSKAQRDVNANYDKAHPLSEAMQKKLGLAVAILERCSVGEVYADYEVHTIRYKFANSALGDHLAVVTGTDGEGMAVVAFHTAQTVGELIVGVAARIQNGTLKWRVDEYRN